jgi:hypothetical protein
VTDLSEGTYLIQSAARPWLNMAVVNDGVVGHMVQDEGSIVRWTVQAAKPGSGRYTIRSGDGEKYLAAKADGLTVGSASVAWAIKESPRIPGLFTIEVPGKDAISTLPLVDGDAPVVTKPADGSTPQLWSFVSSPANS